jgi:thymidylate kinase
MITLILVIQLTNVLGTNTQFDATNTRDLVECCNEETLNRLMEQTRIPKLVKAFQSILQAILKVKKVQYTGDPLNKLATKIDTLESWANEIKPKDIFDRETSNYIFYQKIVQYIQLNFTDQNSQQGLLINLLPHLITLSDDQIEEYAELIMVLSSFSQPNIKDEERWKKILNTIYERLAKRYRGILVAIDNSKNIKRNLSDYVYLTKNTIDKLPGNTFDDKILKYIETGKLKNKEALIITILQELNKLSPDQIRKKSRFVSKIAKMNPQIARNFMENNPKLKAYIPSPKQPHTKVTPNRQPTMPTAKPVLLRGRLKLPTKHQHTPQQNKNIFTHKEEIVETKPINPIRLRSGTQVRPNSNPNNGINRDQTLVSKEIALTDI